MATANTADFLGEGTNTGAFAPTQTPEQLAEQQRVIAEQQRQQAANQASQGRVAVQQANASNRAGKMYIGEDAHERKAADLAKGITGGEYRTPAEQRQWEKTHQRGIGGNLIRDPLTMGILAAPYGVVGAGAAIGGGAALGLGEAAAVGGGTLAPVTAAPSLGAVGTVASPFAAPAAGAAGAGLPAMYAGGAGAAGAAGAAGGAGAAAGGGLGGLSAGTLLGLGGLALDAGGIVASQIRTKAENDLIEKQKELAAAAKARQLQVQQEGMNRLGQTMLAFVPQNKMMAEMFGPDAAFTGQQMGAMAADPGAKPMSAYNVPPGTPLSREDIDRTNADQARQAQVAGAFGPAPQGPAPLQKRTPQAARRF